MLRNSKHAPEDWFYLESSEKAGGQSRIRARDGRSFVKFPVGFPFQVILHDRERMLSTPARLRLMKSVSRAMDRLIKAGGVPDEHLAGKARIHVDVGRQTPHAPGSVTARRLGTGGEGDRETWNVSIGVGWLESGGDTALSLQKALAKIFYAMVPGDDETASAGKKKESHIPLRRKPKVLLFRNPFSEYYRNPASDHMTGTTQVLMTSLECAGIDVVLCNSKFPYHDPAGSVPRRDAPMSVEEFITGHEELDGILRMHQDLSLVVLTVIEFCYNHVRHLLRYIRDRSSARIAVGGTWPTTAPEHAFVHLPEADFLVRGDGEDLVAPLARAAAAMAEGGEGEAVVIDILGDSEGVLARWNDGMASFGIDRQNYIPDLDRVSFSFSRFQKADVESGISISTSRGCIHNCRFCTIGNRSMWRGISVGRIEEVLTDYEKRLLEIYGSSDRIPRTAREIIVWDDDFFIDPERTRRLLELVQRIGFGVTYAQGTVRSFYKRDGSRVRPVINGELLDAVAQAFHAGNLAGLLIGTENYCDEELRRLGKSHTYAMIEELTLHLARMGVLQSHLMILVNVDTTLDNLLQNLTRLSELRKRVGPTLHFNDPCWLVTLYSTQLYKACVAKGRAADIPNLGVASVPGYPEFDYPFIIPERPRFDEVYEIVRRFPRSHHYGIGGRPRSLFEGIYGPKDGDFSMVLGYIRGFLQRRSRQLGKKVGKTAREEKKRIDAAMKKYFR